MRETTNFDGRPRRQEQIVVQKGLQDALLFNMDDGSYYALNEVGNRIWESSATERMEWRKWCASWRRNMALPLKLSRRTFWNCSMTCEARNLLSRAAELEWVSKPAERPRDLPEQGHAIRIVRLTQVCGCASHQ